MSLAYEALLLVAVLLFGSLMFTAAAGRSDFLWARPALQLFLLGLSASYFVWQWHRGGQTLPMKTWRIRLVSAGGGPLTLARAAGRFTLAVPSVLLGGIGILWAFFDRDRQFLHDRLAGTRIVMSPER